MIDLTWALVIWLAVLILIYFLAKTYHIRGRSAFVLAWLLATIVLGIIRPLTQPDISALLSGNNLAMSLYSLIILLTFIIIIVYIVGMAVIDRDKSAVKVKYFTLY